MAKQLTAQEVLDFLLALKDNGTDLEKVTINYRADRDSDVVAVEEVEEDLYDEVTNNILESIVFITDSTEL